MVKGLYTFQWDCGRMGQLEGAFIADSETIESIIGQEVHFGEVLGKHSDVFGVIENSDITLISDNPEVVEKLGNFSIGHNPLGYMES